MLHRTVASIGIVVATSAASAPQQATSIRDLGPIVATSADSVYAPVIVRSMSNGNVFVMLARQGQLRLFDSTLSRIPMALDSSAFSRASSLIPFKGDSTMAVDLASRGLLILDPRGNVARTISLPKLTDLIYVAGATMYGLPTFDSAGRLIYRGVIPRKIGNSPLGPLVALAMSPLPDSAPLVRTDFDTRAVDTIGSVFITNSSKVTSVAPNATGDIVMKREFNPMFTSDDWVGLGDGTVAIVRAHTYHIDWIRPNGSKFSSPAIPNEWSRRLTDEQKQSKLDSMRPILEQARKTAAQSYGSVIETSDGMKKLLHQIDFTPLAELPDYETPFLPGFTRADRAGNLWVLLRASTSGTGGLAYDVINRDGKLTERVRLPAGRLLAGFGPRDVAYLVNTTTAKFEAARIR